MKSNIPKLQVPTFKPSIPEYMVDSLKDDNLKFLIEQVSIIKQQNRWQSEHIAEVYDYTRTINGKVIELEEFRTEYKLEKKVKEDIDTKTLTEKKRNKKLIITLSGIFGLFLYPLYLLLFFQSGPLDMFETLAKLFAP